VNKRVSERTQTRLAFGAAVILLLVSALAAYATVVRLRVAERWVGHTRDVQSALADLNNISSRAGRARTRYVDTGDNAFFDDYQSTAAEIPPKVQLIERLLRGNPEQSDLLKRLGNVTSD
jgi:CHASE3 domain sensor protein